MLKPIRREDRKADEAVVRGVLEAGEYGVLSTVDLNGQAYGVPMSYVYWNDAIYLHGAAEGHKHDNLAQNGKVSFCIVSDAKPLPETFSMRYQSVIVFGTVVEVSGVEKHGALLSFIDKYSSQYLEQGKKYIESDEHKTKVMKIRIEQISGKVRK